MEILIFIHRWNINALFVVNRLPISQIEGKHRNIPPSGIALLYTLKRIENKNFNRDRYTHMLKVTLLMVNNNWRD